MVNPNRGKQPHNTNIAAAVLLIVAQQSIRFFIYRSWNNFAKSYKDCKSL